MRAEVLCAGVEFVSRPFRVPLQLSSGVIAAITEARATVRVRVGDREATGRGTIYLSGQWAWPGAALGFAGRDEVLRGCCTTVARGLPALCGEPAHPLEMGLRLHEAVLRAPFEGNLPALARALCASPFDAAVHDAVGRALGRSAFDLYHESADIPSADGLFPGEGACAAVGGVIRPAQARLTAWWVVNPSDALPGELGAAIRAHGYGAFKLKTTGDPAVDALRTAEVYRAARAAGVAAPRIDADSNEGNADAASVLEYLDRLQALDADAYAALEYLEQPTDRDILTHRFDWRPVAARKPVLIDEGLTDWALFEEAVAQGWRGFCLKTCKGHSFSLVAAAWARRRGLLLALQDLTNPGLAAMHAALFAARVPMLNGVELNSPRFTPDANAGWPELDGLFSPRDGMHDVTALLGRTGLGTEADGGD